jgi:hypothetical protein
MPVLPKALSEAEKIMLAAAREHGPSSLLLSPAKWLIGKAGKLFGRERLGEDVINKLLIDPSEKLTRSAKFFEGMPGAKLLFGKKLTPEEVAAGTKYIGGYTPEQAGKLLQKTQYGGGLKTTSGIAKARSGIINRADVFQPEQIQQLEKIIQTDVAKGGSGITSLNLPDIAKRLNLNNRQISVLSEAIEESKPYAYRLTKPFETAGKTVVLPMAGAMYVHEKLDRHQKEQLYRQKLKQQARNRMAALYSPYYLRKGASDMGDRDIVSVKKSDVTGAIEMIEGLTKTSEDLKEKLAFAEYKNRLFIKAASLISQGLLDPNQIELWVEQQALEKESSEKTADNRSAIGDYASIGSLVEAKGQNRDSPSGIKAHQMLKDFVYGGGNSMFDI